VLLHNRYEFSFLKHNVQAQLYSVQCTLHNLLTCGYGQHPYWPESSWQQVLPSGHSCPPGHGMSV